MNSFGVYNNCLFFAIFAYTRVMIRSKMGNFFHGGEAPIFCPRRNLNSVEDYSSSSVGVVCRVVCRVSSVSNLKHGVFPNALS